MHGTNPTKSFALLFICLALWTTAETGIGRQLYKRQAKNNCSPGPLQNVVYKPRDDKVTLGWTRYDTRDDCTQRGAMYTIIVWWRSDEEEPIEKKIPVLEDGYVISGLKPWTPIHINVSVLYTDETGAQDFGETTDWETETSAHEPSAPRNLKISEMSHDNFTVVWEPPETTVVPLDGYIFTLCEVESCEKKPSLPCGPLVDTRKLSFVVQEHLPPLRYFWVGVAGYSKGGKRNAKGIGDIASTCFRTLPQVGSSSERTSGHTILVGGAMAMTVFAMRR